MTGLRIPQNHTSRWLKPETSLYINISFQSQEEILRCLYKLSYWVCDWQKLKWRKLLWEGGNYSWEENWLSVPSNIMGFSCPPSSLSFLCVTKQDRVRFFLKGTWGVLLELIKLAQCLLWVTGTVYSLA